MFRFVTKKEYWDIEDSGIMKEIPGNACWHLKDIQDAVAYDNLRDCQYKYIAEVGGGGSRILPVLAKKNYCFNIDKFEGHNNGPVGIPTSMQDIKVIDCYLGSTKDCIEDTFFDVVFSISVVEHIFEADLPGFFADNARIMKSGALSLHLIDIPCGDSEPTEWNLKINSIIKAEFFKHFTPLSTEIIAPEDFHFSCAYATNPDNVMNQWNKLDPSARKLFETSQICTLFIAGTKN